MLTIFDARGQVTRGYVKAGALTVVPLGLLAGWTLASITPAEDVQGYALNSGWFDPARAALAVFVVLSALYLIVVLREQRAPGVRLGIAASVAGTVALVTIGALVAPPAWSSWGVVGSIVAAALLLGGALMAMMWGHWYLTSGRLPTEPMEQMSLFVLGAVLVQSVFVLMAVVIPGARGPDLGERDRRRAGSEPRVLVADACRACVPGAALVARVAHGADPRNDVGDRPALHRARGVARGRGAGAGALVQHRTGGLRRCMPPKRTV